MMDIYFWRQLFILSAGLFNSLCVGFMLAFPSVLNPAITAPNATDIRTTGDHASWITAIQGVGGMLGSFIMAPILQILGRKHCHIALNLFFFIGFIIYPFAKDIAALYAARFIQGISAGGIYINGFIISEYVHPCRRGYFVTLKKVLTALGVLLCHLLSVCLTWRQIGVLATICPFIGIILTLFWPESPSYLAFKGKFAEAEKSFKWLNGDSDESRKQLKAIIEAQREKNLRSKKEINGFKELVRTFLKKDFQKPFLIVSVLTITVDVSGRYYYMAYIIQIMAELVNNKTAAIYFTTGADLLTLIAVCTSTFVIRCFNRRTILFTSGTLCVLLMFSISIIVYLKSIFTFSNPVLWFTATLIILQSFVANIGIVPLAFAIISEIFPLEHKGLGSFTSCLVFTTLYAAVLKITPVLMEHTKLYGTYGIFGVVLAICLVILYKTVPETKDKTLQQIEDELNDVSGREISIIESEKLML